MNIKENIVTKIPLTHIWTDHGDLSAKRKRPLNQEGIRQILKDSPVHFIVAIIGSVLQWIPIEECHTFWKSEVQSHLVEDPDKGFYLENFPDNYAYVASEWVGEAQTPIILLEQHH